jgi:hypothetical protein
MANTPQTPFRLEPHMLGLLDKLAAKIKTTRAAVVRIAVMDMARRYRVTLDAEPCTHPNAVAAARVPGMTCPDCGAVFRKKSD